MRQQQDLAQLPGRFIVPPSAPTVDATGGMETAGENPNNSNAGRMDLAGLANAYMAAPGGLQTGMALQQALQKATPQLRELDPTKTYGTFENGVFTPVIKGAPKEDEFVARLRAAGIDPNSPEGRKRLLDKIIKDSTHQPAPSMNNFGTPIAGVNEKGEPVFFQPTKSGGAPAIVPNVRPAPKPEKELTDAQSKANLFGTRAQEANKVIDALAATGVDSPSLGQQVTSPNGIGGRIATAMATPKQQQIDQAQRDFINAALRRESGAVISADEFVNARLQYFPQPGDSAAVKAQKAKNRKIAIEGILAEVPKDKRGGQDAPQGNDPLGIR
jgi:hypothetical protein